MKCLEDDVQINGRFLNDKSHLKNWEHWNIVEKHLQVYSIGFLDRSKTTFPTCRLSVFNFQKKFNKTLSFFGSLKYATLVYFEFFFWNLCGYFLILCLYLWWWMTYVTLRLRVLFLPKWYRNFAIDSCSMNVVLEGVWWVWPATVLWDRWS